MSGDVVNGGMFLHVAAQAVSEILFLNAPELSCVLHLSLWADLTAFRVIDAYRMLVAAGQMSREGKKAYNNESGIPSSPGWTALGGLIACSPQMKEGASLRWTQELGTRV